MSKEMDEREEFTRYSRRGFMQFIGVGAGVVTTSLLSPPALRQLHATSGEKLRPEASVKQIHLQVNKKGCDILVEPRWSLLSLRAPGDFRSHRDQDRL